MPLRLITARERLVLIKDTKMPLNTQLTYAGLGRRVKQHVTSQSQEFFAVCAPGFEDILAQEIAGLNGAASIKATEGGVSFEGPFELVYASNLKLNTATRILMRIATFTVRSYPELFDKVSRVAWERYLGFGPAVGIEVTAKESRLHHDGHIAATVYDAIEKNLAKVGVRMKERVNAALRVFVRVHDDECTLSIDSSGETLHKRGYREAVAKAPLRETTAAALLVVCDFKKYPIIADPMCGSGTFVIEAARMARGIVPGSDRRFAFEAWPSFGEATWNHIRKKTTTEATKAKISFYASDQSVAAVTACKANAERAGVVADTIIEKADCREFNAGSTFTAKGIIIANLPYGKRSNPDDALDKLYAALGDRLRGSCKGWRYGFVVAEHALERCLKLRSDKVISFVNGGIPVRFITGVVPE